MSLALFDLDNTLVAGDTAQAFSEFLIRSEAPTPPDFLERNHAFMADYEAGRLDLRAYMRCTLSPLMGLSPTQVRALILRYLDEVVSHMILPAAVALIEQHRQAGDTLAIVSATGSHLVEPIATRLGVAHALAVDIARQDGVITGDFVGIPTFREGKVHRVAVWAEDQGIDFTQACFYSDSHNDLPLLEQVRTPVAVDPDPALRRIAEARGWRILSLR